MSWIITVTNAGPSTARKVVVTDPLPAGVTDVTLTPSTGTCTAAGSCAQAPGTTVSISGTVDASFSGGAVRNSASVTSETPDPAPAATRPSRHADRCGGRRVVDQDGLAGSGGVEVAGGVPVPVPPALAPTSPPVIGIPNTGLPASSILWWALTLMAAGSLLLLGTRRRRSRRS